MLGHREPDGELLYALCVEIPGEEQIYVFWGLIIEETSKPLELLCHEKLGLLTALCLQLWRHLEPVIGTLQAGVVLFAPSISTASRHDDAPHPRLDGGLPPVSVKILHHRDDRILKRIETQSFVAAVGLCVFLQAPCKTVDDPVQGIISELSGSGFDGKSWRSSPSSTSPSPPL